MSKLLLRLSFNGEASPQLNEVIFHSPFDNTRRVSTRARNIPSHLSNASIQWTAGVKALCALLLRVRLFGASAHLSGESGSLAASLDYAISKQPAWLVDLFGTNSSGECYVRRLFQRFNPERKRGGPVKIYVNSIYLDKNSIFIANIEGKELIEAELIRLASFIDQDFDFNKENSEYLLSKNAHQFNSSPLNSEHESTNSRNIVQALRSEYEKECFNVLNTSMALSHKTLKRRTNEFYRDDDIQWIAGRKIVKFFNLAEVTDREIYGASCMEDCLHGNKLYDRELIISIPPILAGSLAIAHLVNSSGSIQLNIKSNYLQSVELASLITESESPSDLVVLSSASAARLATSDVREEYEAVMFMPSFTHAIVMSDRVVSESLIRNIGFSMDLPSTPLLLYRSLLKSGAMPYDQLPHHIEARELTEVLRDGNNDFTGIRSFPYYNVNLRYDGCKLSSDLSKPFHFPSVMFARKELIQDKSTLVCLRSQFYDAWNSLRVSPCLTKSVFKEIFSNKGFVKRILRYTGADSHLEAVNI